MSFSKETDTIKYNYGNQSSIFETDKDFGVVRKISDHWVKDNTLFFETGLSDLHKGTISLEFFENSTIRMKYFRYNADNRFEEHLNNLNVIKPELKEESDRFSIEFNGYLVEIFRKDFDFVVTKDGKKVLSLYKRLGYEFFEKYLAPPMGWKRQETHNAYPFISFDLENDENLYGLGEKYKSVERRGIRAEILSQSTNIVNTTDVSYSSIPLLYSTRGYGVLVNSGFKTHFDIGSYCTDALSIMPEEACLDMFIFLDPTLKGLIGKYTDLTGRISNLPDRSYGTIVSRLYYNNADEAITEIKNAKAKDFPIDIVGIDPKWLKLRYTKTCNFNFNDEAFGTLTSFAKEVREFGVETSLWLNTNVQADDTEFFKTCFEKGYLVKDKDGNALPAEIGPGLIQQYAYAIDFTNPEAKKYWQSNVAELMDKGIKYFTADYGGGTSRKGVLANGRSGREMKNFQQYLYPKALYEIMVEKLGEGNVVLYRRPGFIGAHRFAGKWGGDSFTRFQELKNQVRAGISMGMAAEFMWGMDLGGGYRGKPYEELTLRWNQAGSLFPSTRFHGIGEREPWHSSERATENAKKYLLLKRTLTPYYKHFEKQATENGLPMIRALVLEFQNDRFAREIEDQFLIGEDIMVAPVLDRYATTRQVYFPVGSSWINFETNEKYDGGRVYEVDADLDTLPIFIKDGAVLPVLKNSNANTNLDELFEEEITFKAFGDKDSSGSYDFLLSNKPVSITWKKTADKVDFQVKK